MKIEHIIEIIKQAKKGAKHPDVIRLVDAFEEFLALYVQKDQEDTQEFRETLDSSYKNMWQAFDQAAALYGLTGGMIQQYVTTRDNFTADEWQSMETLQKEMGSISANRIPARSKAKKIRKKKGLRI